MAQHTLVARVEEQDDGSSLVRAPALGVVDAVPAQGIYLNAMETFLALNVLGRWHTVLLPRTVQGWVAESLVQGTHCPVEYDQPLLVLRAGREQDDAPGAAAGEASAGQGEDGDLIAVPAPSEGIFYRRPSPDAPSYVEPGDRVTTGSVLGLVEVMKSFNQILYGGPGFPEQGVVVKVKVEDSAEVTFGQTLVLIKPE